MVRLLRPMCSKWYYRKKKEWPLQITLETQPDDFEFFEGVTVEPDVICDMAPLVIAPSAISACEVRDVLLQIVHDEGQ
jgi:hypothetical protein